MQRGAEQQAHRGVADGSDLCGVLGAVATLGVSKGLAEEQGQGGVEPASGSLTRPCDAWGS
ncbi:hypothetical protein GCM10023191_044810 [Actinoallomurus oryzae]|uniref:Uncharacterized protein n=1 Tax=Actinoallomurus oryzae TaxID=502180 RepID=A0ABP8Q977_9ACTN